MRFTHFLTVLFAIGVGLSCFTGNRQNDNRSLEMEILRKIDSCAQWSRLTGDVGADKARAQIIKVMNELSKYDLDQLRTVLLMYIQRAQNDKSQDYLDKLSVVFILNRYIFDVPSDEPFVDPTFGGWLGVPHAQNKINNLWPLSVANEQLQLTGVFRGYLGPPYRAIDEFDHFKTKYGLRKPLRGAQPPRQPPALN
jgi:hypothetical protein